MPTFRFRHRTLPTLCALALLIAVGPAWAQYKWRDARGQLHASDLPPPPDIPARDILQRPAPGPTPARAATTVAAPGAATTQAAPAAAAASAAPVDPELAKRRQQAEQQARQKAQEEEARQATQRAENCSRARDQLALYQSGQRLQRVNRAGEREVVDDATRQAEIRLAQRVIASDCRP